MKTTIFWYIARALLAAAFAVAGMVVLFTNMHDEPELAIFSFVFLVMVSIGIFPETGWGEGGAEK
jgi:hypothetical protein